YLPRSRANQPADDEKCTNYKVKVYKQYPPTDPVGDVIELSPSTHYNIDYIIRHYDYLIETEIQKNTIVLSNPEFLKFVQAVQELIIRVTEDRNGAEDTADGTVVDVNSRGMHNLICIANVIDTDYG